MKKYTNRIEGWMSQRELEWLYKTAGEMKSIVEIGSWKGRSTHALLSACKGVVTAVDQFKGLTKAIGKGRGVDELEQYADFVKNVGNFKNLIILKMKSEQAADEVETAEMIFIDGDHSYESVKQDIELWLPKTTKLICGHDFQWPGVEKAVTEKFGEVKIEKSIWYKYL